MQQQEAWEEPSAQCALACGGPGPGPGRGTPGKTVSLPKTQWPPLCGEADGLAPSTMLQSGLWGDPGRACSTLGAYFLSEALQQAGSVAQAHNL